MAGTTPVREAEVFRNADSVIKKGGLDRREDARQGRRTRKSMGRRVSFAPDAQLETTHLFNKEGTPDQNTNPNASTAWARGGGLPAAAKPEPRLVQESPIPEAPPQDSPGNSTMDLTGGQDGEAGPEASEDLVVASAPDVQMALDDTTSHSVGGYTNVLEAGQHPAWGARVEEALLPAEAPSLAQVLADDTGDTGGGAPGQQIDRWGFAPGDDDTQDLNLESRGRLVMGDTTYNNIYGSASRGLSTAGAGSPRRAPPPSEAEQQHQQLQQQQAAEGLQPHSLDQLFSRVEGATEALRSAVKRRMGSPGSPGLGSWMGTPGSARRSRPRGSPASSERPPRQSQEPGGFSQRSVVGQQPAGSSAPPAAQQPAATPQRATPTSRLAHVSLPGSPAPAGPQQRAPAEGGAPPGSAQPGAGSPAWRHAAQGANTPASLGSPQPLIDLGTPRGRPLAPASALGKRRESLLDATPDSAAKRRLSIASIVNDTGRLLLDGGTDSLPSQEPGSGGREAPGSAISRQAGGFDMTTGLLLEESADLGGTPAQERQAGGALQLRAFAAAAAGPSARQPLLAPAGDATVGSTRLLADGTGAAAGCPAAGSPLAGPPSAHGGGDSTMGLDLGGSPALLEDVTAEGLEPPPELREGWEQRYRAAAGAGAGPAAPAAAAAHTPSVFPGGALLQRTPPPPGSQPGRSEAPLTRSRARSSPAGSVAGGAGSWSPAPAASAGRPARGGRAAATPPPRPAAPAGEAQPSAQKPPLHPGTLSASKVLTRSAAKAAAGEGGGTPSPASARRPPPPPRAHTPLRRTPLPARAGRPGLADFLREVDIQFLDQLRRGASINLADLACDPPPATLQDCYRAMCLVAPEVAQFEEGIGTLQSETAARKASAREREGALEQQDLPLFQQIQIAGPEDHEAIKRGAQALKKLCRLRAQMAWKEWRAGMEAQRGSTLQGRLHLLQHDRGFMQSNLRYLGELGQQVARFAGEARASAAAAAEARGAEAARRRAVAAARDSLAAAGAANGDRAARREQLEQHLAALKAQHAALGAERAARQARLTQLRSEAEATAAAAAALASRSITAEALLARVHDLDVLAGCQGWQLETPSAGGAASQTGGGELCLRFGPLFRLRVLLDGAQPAAQGCLELTRPEESPATPPLVRTLAAELAQAPGAAGAGVLDRFALPRCGGAGLAAAVQACGRRLGRVRQALAELPGLRADFPALCEASAAGGSALRLAFLDFAAGAKFSVLLQLAPSGRSSLLGTQIDLPGSGSLTPEALRLAAEGALSRPDAGARALCAALSALAGRPAAPPAAAAPPAGSSAAAAGAADEASLSVFSNPLFASATPARRLA